ncbi:MAG TPA: hypothetical protein VMK05_17030 [Burkholderiales bacterium]|nr:hypothetical protein [Burkholderiales bacterium]
MALVLTLLLGVTLIGLPLALAGIAVELLARWAGPRRGGGSRRKSWNS